MSRYKVLQIGSGAEYGGGTTYVLMLMEAIKNHGGEVHFACTPGLTLDAVGDKGFKTYPIPAMQREIRPWADFRALLQLIKVIRNGKYDLVHTHTSKGGFLGRLAAKIAGVPAIIHTVHGFAFHEMSSRIHRFLYINLERIAAWCCHRMISVNQEDRVKAIAHKIAGPEKMITIYNGIDTTPFEGPFEKEIVRQELGVEAGEKVIGMVARLAPSKAPEDFVQAAQYVLARRADVKFVMVGDGPIRREIEQLIMQSGYEDRILITGYRTDIPELLSVMDLFVLTTLWEGLPISVLEAMAMSKPVIATNVRGVREVVRDGENGILVPPRDPSSLGAAVIRLLEERDTADQMGIAGRRRVEELFNVDRMTQKTLEVYEQLLSVF